MILIHSELCNYMQSYAGDNYMILFKMELYSFGTAIVKCSFTISKNFGL